jgi:regulatory protein
MNELDEALRKYYHLAIKYIAIKMRTEHEVFIYLLKKECNDDDARSIIQYLVQKKWLNDEDYVDTFIKSAYEYKKKGSVWIRQTLQRKGIDHSIIDRAFITIESNQDFLLAEKLIVKKFGYTNSFDLKMIRKAFHFLLRRGFTLDVIKRVIKKHDYDESDFS